MLLLKYASLQSVLDSADWIGLLLVPIVGRAAALALLLWTPYARPDGIGAVPARNLPPVPPQTVLLLVAILVVLVVGWRGVVMLAGVAIVWYLLRRMMVQRLGGTTGDTAGAAIEITEAVALLVLAV